MNVRQMVIRALMERGDGARWSSGTEFEGYYESINGVPARRYVREVLVQLTVEKLIEPIPIENTGTTKLLLHQRNGFQIRDRAALVREFFGYMSDLESDLLMSTIISLGSFTGLGMAYILVPSPLIVLMEIFVGGWLFASTLHSWRSLASRGYNGVEFLHALTIRAQRLAQKLFPHKRQRRAQEG